MDVEICHMDKKLLWFLFIQSKVWFTLDKSSVDRGLLVEGNFQLSVKMPGSTVTVVIDFRS